MSINVNYYGAESTWVNLPMTDTMTDTFMVGQYSNISMVTYGLASRTYLATKFGMSEESYKQPIDNSYGFCETDGNAPFDNIMYCTGYNNNYPNRIKTYNRGKSTVGFASYANPSVYTSSNYIHYYKSSATGSSVLNNVPINFNPPYPFIPEVSVYPEGVKVMKLSKGAISPALKYDFGNYYVVPYIYFYVLKNEYTINDVDNVTDPVNYSNLFTKSSNNSVNSYVSDLRRFYNDVTNGVFPADKIVICSIYARLYHVTWSEDGTYTVGSVSTGTSNLGTKCSPIPFFHSNSLTPLTFTDWYTKNNPKTFTVNIDTSLIEHYFVPSGSSVRMYNGLDGTNTTGSTGDLTVIAGLRHIYGALYDDLTSYPYALMSCAYDDVNFTVKWFEEYGITNKTRKYAVSVYSTLSNFGGLDGFREYVRKSIAYFGCYFSECIYPNATKDWNSPECFIGTIDDNGITHGNYTNGTDNDNQRQKEWGDAWSKKTPYNPNKPTPTPTDENDKGDLNTRLNSGTYATSAKYYATTEQQITKLIDFINTYAPTDAELTADFKGVNPSDYITNVLFFPFDVMYSGAASPIYLSVLNTTATGLKFNPSFGVTVADFGGISIDRYFNDFRDFAPYTKLSLNIPFANTVDLDIGEYYGHTLNIKAVIDFTTGDMLFLIMRDALVTKTVSCNCAIQLPLSALAMGTYQQTLNTLQSNANINSVQSDANDVMTITNTGVAMIGAAMSYGATSLISNPINTVVGGTSQRDILAEQAGQINYAIKHTTPSPMTISGGTPCNLAMLEYIPRYTITRCKSLNIIDYNTYGYTVGFATAQQGRVSDFTGFIVCSDIEFNNISATAQEQEIIKNMLKSGVVV